MSLTGHHHTFPSLHVYRSTGTRLAFHVPCYLGNTSRYRIILGSEAVYAQSVTVVGVGDLT